ncbi:hypothetical protein F4604DRAFT_1681618 [Suillus subluteus]|nr:hypothetical protein F4604DRAFT_1681618 [Suillus subluteus]
MPDLCVTSDAKLQDVLSVPVPFFIAPSGHLSVAELLLLNLHTPHPFAIVLVVHSKMEITDGQELEVVDEMLDVLESLPWDAPLKGFSAQTVVQQMQASDDEDLQSVSVEPLDFADILWLNEKWWNNYETDRAFVHLRTIGSALHDSTLHHILFPINIDNIHWAVIEVNTVN